MNRIPILMFTTTTLLAASFATTSHADLLLVDDFDGLTPGAIDGQNGWIGNQPTYDVKADPSPAGTGDQVLASGPNVDASNESAYKPFASAIADGDTGTLFFQLLVTDANAGTSFGIMGGTPSGATQFDHFRAQLAVSGAGDFVARNGGSTLTLDQSLATDTWYDVWIVADNASDTYEAYIQGGAFASQTQLSSGATTAFAFRNTFSGTAPLTSFLLMSGNAPDDGVLIDNIYFDSTGENTTNPIPEPGSMALLALGGLLVSRRR